MSGLGNDAFDAVFVFVIALALFLALVAVARAIGLLPPLRRYRRQYGQFERPSSMPDVGEQLQAVMAGAFHKQRILNSAEYHVFKLIEDDIATIGKGYRVFAQTCLGEVLRARDEEAFRAINSKRVDMLVVDRAGWPVLAVEYQGSGHYQGTAAARDAVKKEALRKAGVGYLEVLANDSDAHIRYQIRGQLGLETEPDRKSFGVATSSGSHFATVRNPERLSR